MLDTDKLSLGLAAQYVGITTGALEALELAGWIKPVAYSPAGRIPIYLGVDLKRLKLSAPKETQEQRVQGEIRERREELQAVIRTYSDRLQELKNLCSHPSATKENKSSTGNYDPSQDAYWRECVCPDCGKLWTEDQ